MEWWQEYDEFMGLEEDGYDDWYDDEEEEPPCLGNYIPGDETCDFRCEWRDICIELSGLSEKEKDEERRDIE